VGVGRRWLEYSPTPTYPSRNFEKRRNTVLYVDFGSTVFRFGAKRKPSLVKTKYRPGHGFEWSIKTNNKSDFCGPAKLVNTMLCLRKVFPRYVDSSTRIWSQTWQHPNFYKEVSHCFIILVDCAVRTDASLDLVLVWQLVCFSWLLLQSQLPLPEDLLTVSKKSNKTLLYNGDRNEWENLHSIRFDSISVSVIQLTHKIFSSIRNKYPVIS
jgi:hypothetical protein